METKKCIKCGKILSLDNFYKANKDKERTINTCKECCNIINRQYHKENKEHMRELNKKYGDKHREALNEYARQNFKINKVELLKKQKIYNCKNREKLLEQKRAYYMKNIEKIHEDKKKYTREHLPQFRAYRHKRDALKKQLLSTLTTQQWNDIKLHFNNRCCYCGKEKPLQQEHFIPLTGKGEYTQNNIICACINCNSSKRDKSFFEWYPKYKHYSKKREQIILKFLGYNNSYQQLKII